MAPPTNFNKSSICREWSEGRQCRRGNACNFARASFYLNPFSFIPIAKFIFPFPSKNPLPTNQPSRSSYRDLLQLARKLMSTGYPPWLRYPRHLTHASGNPTPRYVRAPSLPLSPRPHCALWSEFPVLSLRMFHN